MPALPGLAETAEQFNSGPPTEIAKLNKMVRELAEHKAYLEALGQIVNQPLLRTTGQCELFPYRFDDNYIGVTWGRICGRQPSQFFAGGFPVFTVGAIGQQGFIYAVAEANLDTLQWKSAAIQATQEMKDNTTTIAYALIGSYARTTDGSNTLLVQGTCGPVDIDICELLAS